MLRSSRAPAQVPDRPEAANTERGGLQGAVQLRRDGSASPGEAAV